MLVLRRHLGGGAAPTARLVLLDGHEDRIVAESPLPQGGAGQAPSMERSMVVTCSGPLPEAGWTRTAAQVKRALRCGSATSASWARSS